MADVEKLREILTTKQEEFIRQDPDTRQFIQHRILNGNSLFGWPERILHIAFLQSRKRSGNSTSDQMRDDYEAARLIVEIQKYNLVKKHLINRNGS